MQLSITVNTEYVFSVNENPWRIAVSVKIGCLIRTSVLWRGWNVAGPGATILSPASFTP